MNPLEKLEQFAFSFSKKKLKPKQIIVRGDQNPTHSYFIKKGHVRQYSISDDGEEITIHIFTKGSFFPLMVTIASIENRYYYESVTESEIYIVPNEKVLEFFQKNPDVLFAMTKRILSGLDKLAERIENLSNADAETRMINVIMLLAHKFGTESPLKIEIPRIFSHKDLGEIAGLSRETTTRLIKKIEHKGIIQVTKKAIIVNKFVTQITIN